MPMQAERHRWWDNTFGNVSDNAGLKLPIYGIVNGDFALFNEIVPLTRCSLCSESMFGIEVWAITLDTTIHI